MYFSGKTPPLFINSNTLCVQPSRKRPGFALIMALGLMALIVLLLLTLSALLSVESTASREQVYSVIARQNAQVGLMRGLGLLQEAAGPDQRVTASSDLILSTNSSGNSQWTGVWKSKGVSGYASSQPVWLVSGNNPNPATVVSGAQSVVMAPTISAADSLMGLAHDAVRVVKQPVKPLSISSGVNSASTQSPDNDGYYAFWVSDEGVKAKVNLAFDPKDPTMVIDAYAAGPLAQKSGIGSLDDRLVDYVDLSVEMLRKVGRLGEMSLLMDQNNFRKYQHDLTACSWGLLTDTLNGGWRLDLTAGFNPHDTVFNTFFGPNSKNYYLLRPFAESDEFKSDSNLSIFANRNTSDRGPNMDLLRDYARFFENANWSGNKFEVIPVPSATGQQNNEHVRALFRYPYQPTTAIDGMTSTMRNSAVSLKKNLLSPVVTGYRFGIRMRPNTKVSPKLASARGATFLNDQYALSVDTQYFVSLYNPYNVPLLLPDNVRLSSPVTPYCHFRVLTRQKAGDAVVADYWFDGATHLKTNTDQAMIMTMVFEEGPYLLPGEVRVYGGVHDKNTASRVYLGNTFDRDGYQTWPLSGAALTASPTFDLGSGTEIRVGVGSKGINLYDSVQIISAGPMPPKDYSTFSSKVSLDQRRFALDTTLGPKTAQFIHYLSIQRLWEPMNNAQYKGIKDRSPVELAGLDSSVDIASWGFRMRMTTNDLGMRPIFDGNIRGYFGTIEQDNNSFLADGTVKNADTPLPGLYEFDNGDAGVSGSRNDLWGLVSYSYSSPPDISGLSGSQGYWGAGSQDTVVLFDMPRRPVLSVGAFQHATLGLYFNEPSYVAGNSYANRRISNQADLYYPKTSDPLVYDISYMVNETLWDGFFFSGLEEQDGAFLETTWKGWKNESMIAESFNSPATRPLPNPRLVLAKGANGETPAVKNFFDLDDNDYRALASYLRVNGPFNVNSTSVAAWKALLMGMSGAELPILDPKTGALKTETVGSGKTSFPRMSFSSGDDSDSSGDSPNFWKGYRTLSESEAEKLAKQIVEQVRARGPFRSMADFVNRKLASGDLGVSGALQSAIDNSGLNAGITSKFSKGTGSVPDWEKAPSQTRTGDGFPGAITQGDILQALAPVLTVRSDTFKIRAYGEVLDSTGSVAGKAWCEAIVQRSPEYCDPDDGASTPTPTYAKTRLPTDKVPNDDKLSTTAEAFGRQFKIVNFRWINENEL